MSRTISPKAKRRGRRIAKRGFVAVTKSAEGEAVANCRRSVHHHPRPIGRVEIYRETRFLSTGQIVAGKFRPKKKRRGQTLISNGNGENKKDSKSSHFVGGGKIKL